MKKFLLTLLLACSLNSYAQKEFGEGLYATINTSKGDIIIKFTPEKTPLTVANFIALAEGNQSKADKKFNKKPFYDGLKFHRVINDFMIQGGDPNGDGSGGPGYFFTDEFVSDLKHDKPGVLSMANRGPVTNGSQFFITHKPTPWLDGKHTVFGHVVKGQNIVDAIEQGDVMKKVIISKIGKKYKNYNANKTFKDSEQKAIKAAEERKIKAEQEQKKLQEKAQLLSEKANAVTEEQLNKLILNNKNKFEKLKNQVEELPSGLKYFVYEKGKGNKPNEGETIYVDYAGYLENGILFDSGIEDVAIANKNFNVNRKLANAYAPLELKFSSNMNLIKGFTEGLQQLNKGDKAILIIPPDLGYGPRATGSIPENSTLIFDIHLLNK